MRTVPKIIAGLLVVVAIGLAVGWWASRDSLNKPPSPPPVTTGPSTPGHSPGSNPSTATGPETGSTHGNPAGTSPGAGTPQNFTAIPATGLITNWEDRLEEVLGAETDDTNKLKQLFVMFPHLPPDGQLEVAQHLSNLVEDEDYAPLGKLLTDAKLPEDVLDVLLADVLNRPNAVKLPMFLDVARNPEHSKAQEAKDLLELYLEEDYGTDWPKWDAEMKKWLKENPD